MTPEERAARVVSEIEDVRSLGPRAAVRAVADAIKLAVLEERAGCFEACVRLRRGAELAGPDDADARAAWDALGAAAEAIYARGKPAPHIDLEAALRASVDANERKRGAA